MVDCLVIGRGPAGLLAAVYLGRYRRSVGWANRHHRAINRALAIGAAWPAILRRQPTRCCRQYRYRGSSACGSGRTYAPPGECYKCSQRDIVREAQLRFHSRHRASRQHQPHSARAGSPRLFSSENGARVDHYAKANPGKINIATPPKGTAPYMAAELFMMMAGVELVHVPYRGSPPMLIDLFGGQVQVAFDGIS